MLRQELRSATDASCGHPPLDRASPTDGPSSGAGSGLSQRDGSSERTSASRGKVRRVAIVLAELQPGGMERVVVHLATHLRHFDVEPMVICLQQLGPLAKDLQAAGVPVVALGSTRGRDVVGLMRLARLLRKFRPDLIHVHDYSSLPYVALARSLGSRSPIVFTAHGLLYEGFEGLQRRCRLFSRWLSSLIAVSEAVQSRHTEYLDWKGRTCVIPNGVPEVTRNPTDRHAIRHELGIAHEEFVFLAVGNCRPEKAFEDLIAAAKRVEAEKELPREFSVLIAGQIGDDDYSHKLRRLAERSHVPGLRLIGYRADVQRLYSAADAFVISSRSEGLPLVLLEAMTAGLPVIATRVGGIPHAVPPECGRLVPPECPDELAEAMRLLLNSEKDVLQSMASAARQWAIDKYGVTRMVEQYMEWYTTHVH